MDIIFERERQVSVWIVEKHVSYHFGYRNEYIGGSSYIVPLLSYRELFFVQFPTADFAFVSGSSSVLPQGGESENSSIGIPNNRERRERKSIWILLEYLLAIY